MSWCDKLHLEDATVCDLLQELEAASREINDNHIVILKELIAEFEK